MVWTLIKGECLAVTAKAILLQPREGGSIWIPLSQIEQYCLNKGDTTERPVEGGYVEAVDIPRWLAEKHDLEIDED